MSSIGPALSSGWPATERIRPAAPAISCAYPVTADVASRTVSPGLACVSIISVLEQNGARRSCPWVSLLAACVQRGETPLMSLGFPPRRLRSSALGSLPGPWLVTTFPGWSRAWMVRLCPGLGWRTGFPRAAPAVWISLVCSQSCGAVRPAQGARRGVFLPGGSLLPMAPRRSLPGCLLGPAWDIPVLLSDTAHRLARSTWMPARQPPRDILS